MTDNTPIQKNLLTRLAEALAALLIFLLPVKMALMVSIPEMPMDYPYDFWSIVLINWPMPVFAVLSGLLLLLTLAAGWTEDIFRRNQNHLCTEQERKRFFPWMNLYGGVWILAGLVSFLGMINASCREYADQMIYYTFGVISFTLSAGMLLKRNPRIVKVFTGAVLAGLVLAVLVGIDQYFFGFQELENYLKEQAAEAGVDQINGKLQINLDEKRITSNFAISNIFGGYLAALMPLLAVVIWRFASERVQP